MADAGDHKTIMFSDVVDSTGLYEELGDAEARRVMLVCMELMEEVARDVGGEPLKRMGDEILCRFDSPDDAAFAARRIHERIIIGAAGGAFPMSMRIRIGFAHGPVIQSENDVFGSTVHTAARIASLAKAHQTLTTLETLAAMHPDPMRQDRYVDRVVLKGQLREQEIHELIWDANATVVPTSKARRRASQGMEAVELSYQDKVVRVDAQHPRITLGRDPACALQVHGNAVSRHHARVSWNRGQVRIEDVSSNATGLDPEGGPPRTVHHDSALLSGRGVLVLGRRGPEGEAANVTYRCIQAS